MTRWRAALAALAVAAVFAVSGCGGSGAAAGSGGDTVQLSLVAYSTPQVAYEAIIKAYQASAEGTNKDAGVSYLDALFKNVPVQDDSARKALQTFTGGKGDVMLAYENEAIFAQQNKQPLDYVVPGSTILIENPVAVTKNSMH